MDTRLRKDLPKIPVRNVQGHEIPRPCFPAIFISTQHLFWWGCQAIKRYNNWASQNLSLETLSGQQEIEFEKISDLTSHIHFKMTHSMLSNPDRKDRYNAENYEKVKEMHEFFKKPSHIPIWGENNWGHFRAVRAQKIWKTLRSSNAAGCTNDRKWSKIEIDDYFKTMSEFNKVDVAVTNQKREDYYDKLFDDITNEGDRDRQWMTELTERTYLQMMTICLMTMTNKRQNSCVTTC